MGAIYKGLQFKTRLEAHWAAFFDLAGWDWHVNPACVGDWSPDFWVSFRCHHSECTVHTLLVAVLPIENVEHLKNHPCLQHIYSISDDPQGIHQRVNAGALFGANPNATRWEFAHGSGGGQFDVSFFVDDVNELWLEAEKEVLGQ